MDIDLGAQSPRCCLDHERFDSRQVIVGSFPNAGWRRPERLRGFMV